MKVLAILLIALGFVHGTSHYVYNGVFLDIDNDETDGVASCPLANGTTSEDPSTVLPKYLLATGGCYPFWSTFDRATTFYMLNGSSSDGWDGRFLCLTDTCALASCGFQFTGLKKLGTSGMMCAQKNFTAFNAFNLSGAMVITEEDVSADNAKTMAETTGNAVFAGWNSSDSTCAGTPTFYKFRPQGDCFPSLPDANKSVAVYCLNGTGVPTTVLISGTLTCEGSQTPAIAGSASVPSKSATDGTAIGSRLCFSSATCLSGPGSTAYCGSSSLTTSTCATTGAPTTTAAGGGTTTAASGASSLALSGFVLVAGLLALIH